MQLNFIAYLQEELRLNPPPRKGLRTKQQLKIAAARVLSEHGYHSLRLRDVTDLADLAEGTIYLHYGDRPTVINAVMTSFLEDFLHHHLEAPHDRVPDPHDNFAVVRAGIRHWFALCRENQGLFRCLSQMADDEPTFSMQVQQFNLNWSRKITINLADERARSDLTPPLLLTYAMKFMLSDLVRRMILYPDPMFREAVAEVGGDDMLVADAASLIWLRTLYPDAPQPVDVDGHLAELVAWIFATPLDGMSIAREQTPPPSRHSKRLEVAHPKA